MNNPAHFISFGFEAKMKLIYALYSLASVESSFLMGPLNFGLYRMWYTRALLGTKYI